FFPQSAIQKIRTVCWQHIGKAIAIGFMSKTGWASIKTEGISRSEDEQDYLVHNIHAVYGQRRIFVFLPLAKEISTGSLPCQEPPVKSGISIGCERLATDHSLSGKIALHEAASYTSWSKGSPLRRQSISRQSIRKSIPP